MNDDGKINQRILASLHRTDPLKKLESAYRTYPTTFFSPDLKRLYLRFFEITAVNVHYVEVIARMEPNLGPEVAEKCEGHLMDRMQTILDEVDKALDGAAALMQANGLTQEVRYLADGLELEVRVTSPIMRNYLKLMEKTEQLIGLLETLRIDGVISNAQCDGRRGALKAQVKTFASAARQVAVELRARARRRSEDKPSVDHVAASNAAVAIHANGSNGEGSPVSEPAPAEQRGAAIAEPVIEGMEKDLKKRWRSVAPPKDKRVAA